MLISRKLVKPLAKLNQASAKLAKGQFDVDLDYSGNIQELDSLFNDMRTMAEELSSVSGQDAHSVKRFLRFHNGAERDFRPRELPKFNIEGITVEYLKGYHGCTDIAIILAYNGLIRNPKSAYLLKRPVIRQSKP